MAENELSLSDNVIWEEREREENSLEPEHFPSDHKNTWRRGGKLADHSGQVSLLVIYCGF